MLDLFRTPRLPPMKYDTKPKISFSTSMLCLYVFFFCALAVQEFVKIARLRLQMGKIGVPPNAEMQARAEGKDPSSVAAEVRDVAAYSLAEGKTGGCLVHRDIDVSHGRLAECSWGRGEEKLCGARCDGVG